MPTYPLTDAARDLRVESFCLAAADLGLADPHGWSVTKRTLRGGRRDGVDLIEVGNGALSFSLIPTRGLGLWKGSYRGLRLGWDSPVADGPVHPSLVNQAALGGAGWLDGFDEWMVRCGLESNGPPSGPHPLHGRIANVPAHYVAVHVDENAPHAIAVEGHVEEARLFGPRLRLVSKVTTVPGSNRLVVRDEVTNLKDGPGEFQLLYHWNFGPPFLEEGSRALTPAKAVAPRDARAREGVGHFDTFAGPRAGFGEQVYFYELHGEGDDGRTLTVLRDRDGDKAVALRFSTAQLPCFTLWKCTGGPAEGYVTGLEPATNYPNPRPFEAAHGRVRALGPGESRVIETDVEVLNGREAVAAVEAEVAALQRKAAPVVHPGPVAPFCPGD